MVFGAAGLRGVRTYAWIALAVAIPSAGGQCLSDAAGNAICVSTQSDSNICGYPMKILGSIYGQTFYCHDIVVEKKTPDGQAVYRRVLGGNSEDTPASLFCDAQGNPVLLGTTWSSDFPVTADAAQKAYAGPPPSIGTGYALDAGGDLVVAVLDPAGKLLYATFAGSSGNDLILGTRDAGGAQAEVLVHAGASDFPVTSAAATSGGPVLITYDLTRRAPLRSAYLPVGGVAYTAELLGDGTVRVTTAGGVYTFGADGALRMLLPLDSFAFREIPYLSFDGSGDLWLVGRDTSGVPVVAKFTGGTVEAFRWSPPVNTAVPYAGYAYLVPPFFGPDGLVYLRGTGKLESTTPNALLEAPCAAYDLGMVAVLSSQGEVKLVSYVAGNPQSFAVDEQGGVVLVETDGTRVPMDLAQRPKAGCVRDVLERYNGGPPFAAGQVVRLRGGGFGPELEAVGVPGADGRFGTLLSGVTVEVDGIAAPILSVQAGGGGLHDSRRGDRGRHRTGHGKRRRAGVARAAGGGASPGAPPGGTGIQRRRHTKYVRGAGGVGIGDHDVRHRGGAVFARAVGWPDRSAGGSALPGAAGDRGLSNDRTGSGSRGGAICGSGARVFRVGADQRPAAGGAALSVLVDPAAGDHRGCAYVRAFGLGEVKAAAPGCADTSVPRRHRISSQFIDEKRLAVHVWPASGTEPTISLCQNAGWRERNHLAFARADPPTGICFASS